MNNASLWVCWNEMFSFGGQKSHHLMTRSMSHRYWSAVYLYKVCLRCKGVETLLFCSLRKCQSRIFWCQGSSDPPRLATPRSFLQSDFLSPINVLLFSRPLWRNPLLCFLLCRPVAWLQPREAGRAHFLSLTVCELAWKLEHNTERQLPEARCVLLSLGCRSRLHSAPRAQGRFHKSRTELV